MNGAILIRWILVSVKVSHPVNLRTIKSRSSVLQPHVSAQILWLLMIFIVIYEHDGPLDLPH